MIHWTCKRRLCGLLTAALLLAASPAAAWQTESTTTESTSTTSGTSETSETTDPDATDPGLGGTTGVIDFGEEIIVKVEEDWLLDIAVTDENSTAPEIVTVFGPGNPDSGLHACFEMNHATYPTFAKGGMQIQSWFGTSFLAARKHPNSAELLTTVERIQYTCVTRINSGILTMEIKNGDSITFGTFGGDSSLRLRFWTGRLKLNSYNPNHSINHSRVTFGANRVNRFLRTEVRYYTADGDVIVDETDRYVHKLVEADAGPAPLNE